MVDNRIPRTAAAWPETVVQGRFNTAASERSLSFAHDSGSENIAFHADGFFIATAMTIGCPRIRATTALARAPPSG